MVSKLNKQEQILSQQINSIKEQFDKLTKGTALTIEQLSKKIQQLSESSAYLDDRWNGAWANYNYDEYLNQHSQPVRLNLKSIFKALQSQTGFDFENIDKERFDLLSEYKDFRENIIADLSILKNISGYEKEIELLDEIENYKWGFTANDFISMKKPSQMAVYDPTILNTGIKTPPHIAAQANIISSLSCVNSIKLFQDKSRRIIKQVELKIKLGSLPPDESEDKVSKFVIPIIKRFHHVATQFRNRYNNETRPAFIIKDEYDVQDLLHSLLKINFDDIRTEDNVPSFAGKNSRVDFLLKNEKVVIEVKKTRTNLKEKQIGEQLILDIAYYKSNSEYKRLICFVYDPETIILNPRGLEHDLQRLSTDEFIVEVYIVP
jgi:hypothetical protein